MNAIRELLHWLVDRVEANAGDRAAAHDLVDEAHPAEPAAGGAEAAAEPAPQAGEGGSQP